MEWLNVFIFLAGTIILFVQADVGIHPAVEHVPCDARSTTLMCHSTTGGTIAWKHGDTYIKGDTTGFEVRGDTLIVKHPQQDLRPKYKCEVSNGAHLIGSATATLYLPNYCATVKIHPDEVAMKCLDKTTTLTCSSDNTATFLWKADEKPINQSNSMYEVKGDILTIIHGQVEEQTNYSCELHNGTHTLGRAVAALYLPISCANVEIVENVSCIHNPVLTCSPDKTGNISWMHNNNVINDPKSERYTIEKEQLIIRGDWDYYHANFTCTLLREGQELGEATVNLSPPSCANVEIVQKLSCIHNPVLTCSTDKDGNISWMHTTT